VHSAQRTLLIIMIAMILLLGISEIHMEKSEKLKEQWETIQTEQFMRQVVRTGRLDKKEYIAYKESLNYSGVSTEVRIEEYQKEEDITGKIHFRLLSSQEIEREIFNSGEILFRAGSLIKITVFRNTGRKNSHKEYIETIERKG